MKASVLVTLLFFFGPSFDALAGGSAVGNGGFGIFRGESVRLFDLAEAGIVPQCRNLPEAFLPYSEEVTKIAEALGVRSELLDRYLRELDNLRPRLGWKLANVIRFYEWKVQARLVKKTQDVCASCRQIAIRTMDKITIDGSLWKRMDQENRIALMFHEALFAIMRSDVCPRRENKIACGERHFVKIREIVATIFAPLPWGERKIRLEEFVRDRLSVELSIWGDDFRRDKLGQESPSQEGIEKFARTLCKIELERMGSQKQRYSMLIPFEIEDTIYGPQYFLKFLDRSSHKIVKAYAADKQCARKLASLLSDWFGNR